MSTNEQDEQVKPIAPADVDPGEPGAEGGEEGSVDTPPGLPAPEDDSALGDSDQHSSANA